MRRGTALHLEDVGPRQHQEFELLKCLYNELTVQSGLYVKRSYYWAAGPVPIMKFLFFSLCQ